MVDALESFGSVFIPFYFFHAGTEIAGDQLTFSALGFGLLLVLVCIPIRIGLIVFQRRHMLGESFRSARRIGSALVPTLVFTLVLAEILHGQFGLSDTATGALVLYTILNTSIPAFVLHGTAPEFEHVEASPVGTAPLT
jgi:Kef-type K+ transport system membrane component KefB